MTRRRVPVGRDALDFLVLGAGRGGTSLLAGLLDAHPELEVMFERFSAHLMGREVLGRWRWPGWRLRRDIAGHRIERYLRRCRGRSKYSAARLWGNKITTEQLAGLEDHNRAHPGRPVDVVDLFLGRALAGVKVLFILRDGRSCVESKVRRTGQTWEKACRRWRYSVEVYRYLAGRPESHRLRFEDLVDDPEPVVREVCRFLGVEFVPRMLEKGTRSEKMRPEYRLGRIEPSKAEPSEIPPKALALIENDLRDSGYL